MSAANTTAQYQTTQRAIALAAITQAVFLVHCIASKGRADSEDCRVLIDSLFATPETHGDSYRVYGDPGRLKTGLRTGIRLLGGKHVPEDRAMMIYSSTLLAIEKRLPRHAQILSALGEGMQRIDKQRHYFGDVMHPSVIAALADLYGETISTIKPRVIVRGKTEHLSRTDNTRLVRTLLLAGLRAAHLWKQAGGGHLTLLLKRKVLAQEMQRLIDSL